MCFDYHCMARDGGCVLFIYGSPVGRSSPRAKDHAEVTPPVRVGKAGSRNIKRIILNASALNAHHQVHASLLRSCALL